MNFLLTAELVTLVLIANGAPVLVNLLAGRHWNRPLDGHLVLRDQYPMLGDSKTIRGLLSALVATAAVAPLFGLGLLQGAAFGGLAMLGDLASSFIKRRLGFISGRSAPLLDQLPETLLPLTVMQPVLGATAVEIFAAVCLFVVLDLLLSDLPKLLRRHAGGAG
ncbi:MAG: CDP-archaeol synthase [Gammaproteobacteria bacterium]|jgi:CDP-2,3-bis-(O-geranylgeranyl)-sn-glycerol synthase